MQVNDNGPLWLPSLIKELRPPPTTLLDLGRDRQDAAHALNLALFAVVSEYEGVASAISLYAAANQAIKSHSEAWDTLWRPWLFIGARAAAMHVHGISTTMAAAKELTARHEVQADRTRLKSAGHLLRKVVPNSAHGRDAVAHPELRISRPETARGPEEGLIISGSIFNGAYVHTFKQQQYSLQLDVSTTALVREAVVEFIEAYAAFERHPNPRPL